MAKQITPEKAISFTRLMVAITCCWPLPVTATKAEITRFKILRTFLILSAASLVLPLVNAIYIDRHDPVAVVKSVCLTSAFVHIVTQTIMCANQYKQLQSLLHEAEEYIRDATPWKRDVLQQYTNKCAKFYATVMIWFYFTACCVMVGPAISKADKFPTDAKYPFAVDFLPLKIVLYAHQSLVLFQCAAKVSSNTLLALLIWFTVARFDILSKEMQNVTEITQLHMCIRHHQLLLRYTENVIKTVRFLSLTIVIVTFISLVFNGLALLIPTSFELKIQFGVLNCTALMEVFMLSWPADHLMNASSNIAEGIYESKWYESSIDVQKTLICIVMRARKPMAISVGGILPPMSLNYFASYLSAAFSYFTTLRILVEDTS